MQKHLKADNLQKKFGEIIRSRRQALGISQEELAERCDLHRNYISEIERGLKSASLRTIVLIALALGCHPHILIQEAEEILEDNS
ncbi:MAG: XRE family transcriptional regulator [Microcystis aeruginosa Ma_QC_Ch_20071001_S25]|uniref:XRE family transcriptional regulator n=1 Tax=Microcystis aeruginosa Ma_QC_Ch_20071001_S25D TaxID=2486250 RepID=A0A552FWT8_MICAE|nr:helix-turn-helix transcriptional regulator [Microcystis aeruginosa WS75]TRU51195.1 MAG: XRE family transcriptional regulator [Microcystis aeruginosa Ma_QC_Ch_20071001_S25D]TRU53274.1 MAG: XRE family transcriptional regulator [Microcystis aeruginosa Ma_QC_Ch_20071001_S25]TRU57015.1 MAG: XRE family transcriptional regulator [Microcystis aeruginosa Ma_QC_Ch_20071001_M135]